MPPAVFSFRAGIIDNIEIRSFIIGPHIICADLFFHTNYDSNVNFGITTGTRLEHNIFRLKESRPQNYYVSFTASKEFNGAIPYITYTIDTDDLIGPSFSFGSEFCVYINDNNSFKISLVPEISYYYNATQLLSSKPDDIKLLPSIGVGFIF